MTRPLSRCIHPTAVVSSEAELADDIEVGPLAVIEGPVRIGPGCVIRAHAHLRGPLTLGSGNVVFPGAVLGEKPQHLGYSGEGTGVVIGDDNVFREHVTIHHGSKIGEPTRVGSRNVFEPRSHVAHDCIVGNSCTFGAGAVVGGHCIVEDDVTLGANSAVHQFAHVGRLALLQETSASTKDVVPFLVYEYINSVVGVNTLGMRRCGFGEDQIQGMTRAFHILFSQGLALPQATARVEQELGDLAAVRLLLTFINQSKRGISFSRDPGQNEAA